MDCAYKKNMQSEVSCCGAMQHTRRQQKNKQESSMPSGSQMRSLLRQQPGGDTRLWYERDGDKSHATERYLSNEATLVLSTAGQTQAVTPQVRMDDVLAVHVRHGTCNVPGCRIYCNHIGSRCRVDDAVLCHEPATLHCFLQKYVARSADA